MLAAALDLARAEASEAPAGPAPAPAPAAVNAKHQDADPAAAASAAPVPAWQPATEAASGGTVAAAPDAAVAAPDAAVAAPDAEDPLPPPPPAAPSGLPPPPPRPPPPPAVHSAPARPGWRLGQAAEFRWYWWRHEGGWSLLVALFFFLFMATILFCWNRSATRIPDSDLCHTAPQSFPAAELCDSAGSESGSDTSDKGPWPSTTQREIDSDNVYANRGGMQETTTETWSNKYIVRNMEFADSRGAVEQSSDTHAGLLLQRSGQV